MSRTSLQEQEPTVATVVVSLPAENVKGHECYLKMLESERYQQLKQIVLIARAAPLSKRVNKGDTDALSVLARRYQRWAKEHGVPLFVCGQAAEHYGLRDERARGEGVALTGFMELAAWLESEDVRSGRTQVLVW